MRQETLELDGCKLTVAEVGEGVWFAYGFENNGESVTAPARLLKRVREFVKEQGGVCVQQHRTGKEPEKVNEFWDRYGFVKAYEVYELPL